MKIISIDPGLTGCIAILEDGELLELHDMPTMENGGGFVKRQVDLLAVADLLWLHPEAAAAVVEWVTAWPNNGASSMFSFGYTLASCMAVFTTIGIEVVTFSPQDWHKILSLPAPDKSLGKEAAKKAGKTANRELAARLHPSHAHYFKRVKDHDRADAVLLGHALLTYLQK